MWTQFIDMHSGGGLKESPYSHIYIEAPQAEAEVIFYNRFGHNPNRVTCTCCGEDYSLTENQDLAQASGFERNCEYDNTKKMYVEEVSHWRSGATLVSLEDYLTQEYVLVMPATDITPDEHKGTVPEQGYVWV